VAIGEKHNSMSSRIVFAIDHGVDASIILFDKIVNNIHVTDDTIPVKKMTIIGTSILDDGRHHFELYVWKDLSKVEMEETII
jgi:hypothetical protein